MKQTRTLSKFRLKSLNRVPVVEVDHTPTTTVATEAYTGPSISAPISGMIPMPKQLGSTSGQELETPPTVSDHAVLTIVVANYWPFSTCLYLPVVHYRPMG